MIMKEVAMNDPVFRLFDTAFGPCGIVWREPEAGNGQAKLVFLQLPGDSPQKTEESLVAATGAGRATSRSEYIAGVMEKISLHLQGTIQDFAGVAVDLEDFGAFGRQVLDACRCIKAGSTMSYGQLARSIDHPGAARAVGQILARNPVPLIIPCHRVLAADGRMNGFSAPGGIATKARLLTLEGVAVKGGIKAVRQG
jgi:O-6-methylguanine DNA methyltransferase